MTGHRQQHRAGQGIQEELHRGIDPPRPAPHADQQEHRDQHRFPEHKEQDEIQRQNTPSMEVSISRMQARNSLARVSIERQEQSTHNGMIRVVISTSSRLMPSTPRV